ncbi:hypothetical protein PAAG_06660 [Paracoccidioides lutzii Pb01]|uniref:Protein YAE1 n=1 Tax=Paracoccidioides lutzii (strain ATCC MYA-826 / Pb01) TaxID=502779 RepID=C1H7B9_PARBA|nr:hypothetical protein PAAG_06660 [Paracoccidioides lutzii Pb01]EEH35613.2 hypothetical protein PAAG_06660 [Paracoccidioides lutzii Pb01]
MNVPPYPGIPSGPSHSSCSSLETSTLLRSPTTTSMTTASSTSQHQHQEPSISPLDDIFDTSLPIFEEASVQGNRTNMSDSEPSDLPSLRRQHVTAGYRDGITVAKSEHVQRGFDAGFPVGAELGLRVGIVLGVLEGMAKVTAAAGRGGRVGGRSTDAGGNIKENRPCREGGEDMQVLFETAKKELTLQSIFGAVATDVAVEAEQTGDGGRQLEDPCLKLRRAGEDIVAEWEGRVRELLAESI